jgi:hypothetical protein
MEKGGNFVNKAAPAFLTGIFKTDDKSVPLPSGQQVQK